MGVVCSRPIRPHESLADNRAQGPKSLDDLPDELLVAVARRLECISVYSTMPRVSSRWRDIIANRALLGPPSCLAARDASSTADKSKACLYAHSPGCPRHRLACADAIRAGAGPIALRRLKALGHRYNKDAVMAAIITEDIPSLAELRTSKHVIEPKHYRAMARHGRANMLAWLFANEGALFYNSEIATVAARYGHLECLKLAHMSGIEWSKDITMAAVLGGHVDCLAYAHTYGCPWKPALLYREARSRHHKACSDYIRSHTHKRLDNEPWDTILGVLACLAALALLGGAMFLCVVGVVHLVNGASV